MQETEENLATSNLSSDTSSVIQDIGNNPYDEGKNLHRINSILKGLTFVDSPLIFSGKYA